MAVMESNKTAICWAAGTLVGSFIAGCIGSCSDRNKTQKYYNESSDNTSMALVIDGELYRYANPQDVHFMPNDAYRVDVNKTIYDLKQEKSNGGSVITTKEYVEFQVEYVDSKTAVIYTYNDEKVYRENVMNYIISTVRLDDDNNIILDKNDLTQKGYEEYKESIGDQSLVSKPTQRTRALEEK